MSRTWRIAVLLFLACAEAHVPDPMNEVLGDNGSCMNPGHTLLQIGNRQLDHEGEGEGEGQGEGEGEEEEVDEGEGELEEEEADEAGGGNCNKKCSKRLKFMPLDGVSNRLPYYTTRLGPDVEKGSSRAKKALLIFHGVGMNPGSYFCYGYNALKASSARRTDWYVASVGLYTDAKVKKSRTLTRKRAMSWMSSSHWAYGRRGSKSMSSYEAVDQMLAHFNDKNKYPKLKEVVLAGHGGGGQFLHRFALLSGSKKGLKVTYVVANPSTYLYVTDHRPVVPKKSSLTCDSFDAKKYTAGSWSFEVPDKSSSKWLDGIKKHTKRYKNNKFSAFDDYEYGMTGTPDYFPSKSQIMKNMESRDIKIVSAYHDACNYPLHEKMLSSKLDCGFCCEHASAAKPADCKYDQHEVKYPLKTTIAAMLQGLTRAERAWAYMDYVSFLFPGGTKHTLEAVEGKHSSCEIFQSKDGQRILFGER